MKREYEILNDYLNDYCIYFEYTGFLNYIFPFLQLSIEVNDLVRKCFFFDQKNEKVKNSLIYEDSTKYLSGFETLDLCEQFIISYMPKYYNKWSEYFQSGILEFEDYGDVLEHGLSPKGNFSRNYFKNNQMFREVDISLKHNYGDPALVIHEFFHQLNLSDQGDNKSRKLFSEMISIYFETLMFRFMEEKGYDQKEVSKAQNFRIRNLLSASFNASDNFIFLRDFLLFGSVSDQSFLDSKKYRMLTFSCLDTYRCIAKNISSKLEKSKEGLTHSNKFFEQLNKVNGFYSFRYVLGTAIAYYAISATDFISLENILAFNDSILHDEGIDKSLMLLNLKMDSGSINKVLNGLHQEFDRHKSNLEKEDNLKK